MNRTRFYYLDLLRVFLTMLVFYHHSAVAFGASGGWYYISKETTTGLTQGLLSASMGILFRMGGSVLFPLRQIYLPVP